MGCVSSVAPTKRKTPNTYGNIKSGIQKQFHCFGETATFTQKKQMHGNAVKNQAKT